MFRSRSGVRDVVSVWQVDRESAIQAARDWLEFSQDFSNASVTQVEVEELGAESDPGDIGVAETNEEVNHRRFSSEGLPVSTAFRGEPDEIQRLTACLRHSQQGNWPLIRSLLEAQGVAIEKSAVAQSAEWRKERPQHATIVTSDAHVFLFLDGSSPLDDPSLPPKLPAVLRQAPDGQNWPPFIQLGLKLLRDGSLKS
jgi:hypothetical protein